MIRHCWILVWVTEIRRTESLEHRLTHTYFVLNMVATIIILILLMNFLKLFFPPGYCYSVFSWATSPLTHFAFVL